MQCKFLYGATCCERKTGDGPRFPITYADALKINKWADTPIKDFLRRAGTDPAPEFVDLVVDGQALYLPIAADGGCTYLGPHGCTIPNAKPFVCSTFPFRFDPTLGWTLGGYVGRAGYCYGQDMANDDLDYALMIFGESVQELNRMRKEWLQAKRNHPKQIRWLISG
jgi:Fe-S-cluster containining protein